MILNLMMAVQVNINVYDRFKVLKGEMFHPFGCVLKPVMGRANFDGLVKAYAC